MSRCLARFACALNQVSSRSALPPMCDPTHEHTDTGRVKDGYDGQLVFIDLEMSGLDPQRYHILEAACVVTDRNLRVLGETCLVVRQPAAVLDHMEDWSRRQHALSGLTDACRNSPHAVSCGEAEKRLLQLIQLHVPQPFSAPLAGNSICCDRAFLQRHMPRVAAHLHYRCVDVSSLKELARRWRPQLYARAIAVKRHMHRTLDDVYDSIAELRVYRDGLFGSADDV